MKAGFEAHRGQGVTSRTSSLVITIERNGTAPKEVATRKATREGRRQWCLRQASKSNFHFFQFSGHISTQFNHKFIVLSIGLYPVHTSEAEWSCFSSLLIYYAVFIGCFCLWYLCHETTGWAKKTGMFLRSDNSATTNDRKAFNTSKFSEFGLAWNA